MTNAPVDTLLICANFFGYAREVQRGLVARGRNVLWFEDRPSTDDLTKAFIRIAPRLMRRVADDYFDGIIGRTRRYPIRDVLVIKGEALSVAAVKRLRKAFPKARFTLYFWDSYRNMPADSREKAGLFDRVLTFDPFDAADEKLIYRPLFFLDDYAKLPKVNQDIDFLFVGTIHTDRYAVLRKIERALPGGICFEKILYLPAPWLYFARCLRDPALVRAKLADFSFSPIGKADIVNLIARSRVIVDVERSVQSGYTMRTIETLGAGRKLVTTNNQVAQSDFFSPDNIAIIDRKAPLIPPDFFQKAYKSPPCDILQRYSMNGWLDDILAEYE